MPSEVKPAQSVQLVLLAVFQSLQKAVAEGQLQGNPLIGCWVRGTPAGHQVGIAIISRELYEAGQLLARNVVGSQIDRVIALQNVERAAIDGHLINDRRNKNVGIGVTIAVSIGRQIVGYQERPNLEVLRDGLAVVSGHARSEVLRRLDSSRRGLDGQARNRDRRARPPRIGIQDLIVNEDTSRRIGGRDRRRGSYYRHLLSGGYDLLELDANLTLLACSDGYAL